MNTSTQEFARFLASDLTRQNREALLMQLSPEIGAANAGRLLDLVLNGDLQAVADYPAEGHDRLYLAALVELVKSCPLIGGKAYFPHRRRVHAIDETFDFFFEIRDEWNWSTIRCLNFFYRAKIQPSKKFAVVTSIRNEGINILEWIAHHRLMGADDFIIYANDNDDDSSDMLRLLAEHGIIHIVWNETLLGRDGKDMFSIQAKAYGHVCEFLHEARDFEWLMFSDMDEFLITKPMVDAPDMVRPLNDLLARMETASGVMFAWKWVKSLCKFKRQDGLYFERFTEVSGHKLVKSIARPRSCLSFESSHRPRFVTGDVFLGEDLAPFPGFEFEIQPRYSYAWFNHYWNKSFEEYIAKHLRVRGDAKIRYFFDYGGNREHGQPEKIPAIWVSRLKAELALLLALPGIAAENTKIELSFRAMLDCYASSSDREKEFVKHLLPDLFP